MNILIVEDDAAIREGVAEFLKENEYEVFCAEDGEKALEKWDRSVKRTADVQ